METLIRLSPGTYDFLVNAVSEDPDFLSEYVVPTLNGYDDPEEKILSDLSDEITSIQFQDAGLGDFGNLGKSVFKKVGKTIAKVHKRIGKEIKRVAKKEGPLLIQAAGVIAAPFTGGASLAVASAVNAANQLRLRKIAAAKAKREARAGAAQVSTASTAANTQTTQQLDAFYQQNQAWMQSHGITPEQWAGMSMQQKIDAINQATQQQPQSSIQTPPSGGGYAPSGGGSYAPSGGGGGGASDGGFSPYENQQQGRRVATSSMFDSSMLPLLAGGIALALIFGKSAKGGRRTKRNPGRRRRRRAA